MTKTKKHRWFQFHLATYLIMSLVAGVLMDAFLEVVFWEIYFLRKDWTYFRAELVYLPIVVTCAFIAFAVCVECIVRWRWHLHLGTRILFELSAGALVLWNMEVDGLPFRVHFYPFEQTVYINTQSIELNALIGLLALLFEIILCENLIRLTKRSRLNQRILKKWLEMERRSI